MALLRPCIDCGELSEEARCLEHRPVRAPREHEQSAAARGYDYRWHELSKRARALSPFCQDCGATDDLTADHSPEAWVRKEQGKVIRLQDIEVVCRSCNGKRGAARAGEKSTKSYRSSQKLS